MAAVMIRVIAKERLKATRATARIFSAIHHRRK